MSRVIVIVIELVEEFYSSGVCLLLHLPATIKQTSRQRLTATLQPEVPSDAGPLIPRAGESAIPTMAENTSKSITTFTSLMLAALVIRQLAESESFSCF